MSYRLRAVWFGFALCAFLALAALALVSHKVLRLEENQERATQTAAFQEDVRLALWRMDAQLAPLILTESLRPVETYQAIRFLHPQSENSIGGRVPVDTWASPLLTASPPHVKLYAEVRLSDGAWSSPQVLTGTLRAMASRFDLSQEQIDRKEALLRDLTGIVDPEVLRERLGEAWTSAMVNRPFVPNAHQNDDIRDLQVQRQQTQEPEGQNLRNAQEYLARMNNTSVSAPGTTGAANVGMQPLFFDDELILARYGAMSAQIVWMDWPALRESLLEAIRDILPTATLVPVIDAESEPRDRMLTAIPVRLTAEALPFVPPPGVSPGEVTLSITWLAAALALVAVALLLHSLMSLSERRAAFVSAVSHEMRTPLTTFRLYTDLLDDVLIHDSDKRRDYLKTLRGEANRLGHLVENVLAVSRLDKRVRLFLESVSVADLLHENESRLQERCERVAMPLRIEIDDALATTNVRVNRSAVERILLNLVDNACKYASADAGVDQVARLDLSVARHGKAIRFSLRDYGPGIAAPQYLFRAFSVHSSRDSLPRGAVGGSHGGTAGIGLGLVISRRLARQMRGNLVYRPASPGATFHLDLPTAPPD